MGGEDFAYYTKRAPGCFVAWESPMSRRGQGSACTTRNSRSTRTPALGTALHVQFAMEMLEELR
ncbi:MAG: hypothetical protein CM1200mP2_17630 [Planctomycetaceae bacterium]|nr:MAG: hypothetical protein CM1200mP2_17630 [Planctomycetaceae bacterium]